ncbi:MAG: 23S rRNA (adenine(2030)-N(6))-methyltransferase RlmJ [Vicinamibacterales bacterium]
MAYNHSRKAGNEGDVWKHAVLLAVVDGLTLNDDAIYVESHSGSPVHNLMERGEWQRGAGRVVASGGCDSEYRTTVAPWLRRNEYPASWVMMANRLARRAKTVAVELADTSDQVAEAFEGRPSSLVAENVRVQFHRGDGFELAINVDRPSLVFLDPPFADREREWQLLAGTCMHLKEQGIAFLAWYPYSWHTFPNWVVETTGCATLEVFWAECGEKPSQNLKGCGMLMSPQVAMVLREVPSALVAVPACLGWALRARRPAA